MFIFLLIFMAFCAILILLAHLANTVVAKNQAKLKACYDRLEERFGEGDYFVRLPNAQAFGIAWAEDAVIMGDTVETAEPISFAVIRDANIEVDGVNVTETRSTSSTNRGSQLVGGAVGAAALGPVGLLLGGLSGSSTTTGRSVETRKIKSIKLVIRVSDRKAPVRTFAFHDAGYAEGSDATVLKDQIEKAAHFHALLTNMIEDRDNVAVNLPGRGSAS